MNTSVVIVVGVMSFWVSLPSVIQTPPQAAVAPQHQGAAHPATACIQIMGTSH